MYNPGLLEIYVQLISWNASLCFRCFFSKFAIGKESRIHFFVSKIQYSSLQSYNSVVRFQFPFCLCPSLPFKSLSRSLPKIVTFQTPIPFSQFLLAENDRMRNLEGSYAFHDQHFVCSGSRECWIAVLHRENARVIRAKVCRKVCISRKGRRSSSVDLFFGFRIRLLFISFIRIITT